MNFPHIFPFYVNTHIYMRDRLLPSLMTSHLVKFWNAAHHSVWPMGRCARKWSEHFLSQNSCQMSNAAARCVGACESKWSKHMLAWGGCGAWQLPRKQVVWWETNKLFAFFSSKKGLLVKVKGEMRTGGSISLQNQIVRDYKESAGESLLWSCIVCKQQHVGGVNNM